MLRDDAVIRWKKFEEVDITDHFFDSLKESYTEFSEWYDRKGEESALVVYDDKKRLQGFLYLKLENGPISDVVPPLNSPKVMKVGTFKINAHGTRLGERFVKKLFDVALASQVPCCYVTIFPEMD